MTPLRPLRLAVRTVALLTAASLVYFAVTFVQVWLASRRDDRRHSQAIIVLGAAQYNGHPTPVLRARLDHAADLYHEGVAPVVVVTGGREPGDPYTEAGVGATYLHGKGVPDHAIERETTGRSSWESLAASARFLHEQGVVRVVLVSDPFHSARIEAIASSLGLDAVTSPTRTSPIKGLDAWRRMFGETLRVGVGRIIGYRRLTNLGSQVGKLVPGLAILGRSASPRPGGRATHSGVV